MEFWDEKMETMSRDEMTAFQGARLGDTVKYAYDNTGFYRKKLDGAGIAPEDIRSLEDITRLPFMTKSDLRDNYPYGLCAIPQEDIIRIHASSGTTGKPTPVFYSPKDLENWGHCMARTFYTAGVRKTDVCQIALGYSLFTGAFGHHMGAERIGAAVIPTSSGHTERQIMVMQDFKTTVLHCTPTYAITIAEKMMEMGVHSSELSLRLGVHGAEPMTEELRREVEEKLGSLAIRDFGLTEVGGPGVAIECLEKAGYHVNEDFYFPEIIDPETMEPLPDGETGELVFTTLQKEGVPVIRYRTRDITSLNREPCACGRTLIRMGEIKGRTDDMMIIGGVNFFPSQLESVLLDFEEVAPHYLIRLSKKGRLDRVTVDVETDPSYWSNKAGDDIEVLSERVQKHIKDIVGFNIDIHFVEPLTIPRSEGKAKRVLDER